MPTTCVTPRSRATGLGVSQHEVLAHVFRAPGLTQQALTERCFVAKSGVSMLLSRLEEDGLLTRGSDAKDGRTKRLCLSDSGDALARRCLKIKEDVVLQMMASLSDAQVLAMTVISERVAARAQAYFSLSKLIEPALIKIIANNSH